MRQLSLFILATQCAFMAGPAPSNAQAELCSESPLVRDSFLKADVETRAGFLSKKIVDADFKAQVEIARTSILKNFPTAASISNVYLQYQVCVLVMADKSLSTSDKIERVTKVRQSFQ